MLSLSWDSEVGFTYTVQVTSNGIDWTDLNRFPRTGSRLTTSVPIQPGATELFRISAN